MKPVRAMSAGLKLELGGLGFTATIAGENETLCGELPPLLV